MILNRMHELFESGNHDVKPNAVSYSSVINTWARSGLKDAPSKAEALLLRMQQLHESGYPDVKPNTISFSSVLHAWANSRDPAAALRAEAILDRMQEHHESGYRGVKPHTISFSSVINAWAKSGDLMAPQRAEALLKRMQKMHEAGEYMKEVEALGHQECGPDTITYNFVIKAWSNSGHPDANREITALRKEMKSLATTGSNVLK